MQDYYSPLSLFACRRQTSDCFAHFCSILGVSVLRCALLSIRSRLGQIYLSSPQMMELNGQAEQMFPNMARLRNLTYAAPLFVDITKRLCDVKSNGEEWKDGEEEKIEVYNERRDINETKTIVHTAQIETERVWIGRVPLMLKSTYCVLNQQLDKGLTDLGECPYDQGGYFIINGTEKVLIAQERMSSNHVYVFSGKKGTGTYISEIRSMAEGQHRPSSTLYCKMVKPPKGVCAVLWSAVQCCAVLCWRVRSPNRSNDVVCWCVGVLVCVAVCDYRNGDSRTDSIHPTGNSDYDCIPRARICV